jgi:glyoxylase-like metal-dependent hydrolase (beta-lactamase superfamily II)
VDAEYVRPGYAAVHVIQHNGRAAFVDTGTTHSVPHLLAALDELGIACDSVDYVFLTHVHMDHAGGAGLLIQQLPNARVLIHPRGVPHMIDPSKLVAASQAVYGVEEFRKLYGDVLPIPEDRIVNVPDNYRCSLGGRELELIHTPGHALHHYVIVDREHAAIFAGDTFGLSYRALDTPQGPFIVVTSSPSQFDPDQLASSIDRIMAYAPESIYLMHYSRVTGIPRLATLLKFQIREFVRIARESAGKNESLPAAHSAIRTQMLEMWLTLLQQQGSTLSPRQVSDWLEGDLELNAQGLVIWLQRQKKGAN